MRCPPFSTRGGSFLENITTIKINERLIVPLDLPNYEEAEAMVHLLSPTVTYFKVGMELYYAAGRNATNLVKHSKAKIFLDLKLHDIPNTVARALDQLTEIGVDMINVHISGGETMLKAAREAVETRAAHLGIDRPKLLGVTVLTSISDEDLQQDGYNETVLELVKRRTLLALECGLDGIVCSPKEAGLVKEVSAGKLFTVTPGIRLIEAGDDQKRVTTPEVAINGGSDYLVVGRPITQAADPLAAAREFQRIIEEAVKNA